MLGLNPTLSRLAAPLTALSLFVFCLTGVPGGAAALVQVDADLNDGLVPAGFTLSTTNNAGLVNGRLQAVATNGSGTLYYSTLPAGLSQVDIGYRGHFGPSQWGTYTRIELGGVGTLFHGYSNFNFPGVNRASVGTSSATNPANFSDFDYAITIVDGRIDFSGTDIVSGTEEFNLSYIDASIQLANLTQIGFRAHNTTGTEAVWIDDISLQMQSAAIPAPGAAALFALALAGLGRSRRLSLPGR